MLDRQPQVNNSVAESAEFEQARPVDEWDDALPDDINEISERIIGAAIEVHRRLGPRFGEKGDEAALAVEMELRGISYERQKKVRLDYKGHDIGEGVLDFLVEGKVIVELKAVEVLAQVRRAQCLSYRRVTRHTLCLLINFNTPLLKDGIRRIGLFRR